MNILRIGNNNAVEDVQARNIKHIGGDWYGRIHRTGAYDDGEVDFFTYMKSIDRLYPQRSYVRVAADAKTDDEIINAAKAWLTEHDAIDKPGDLMIDLIEKRASTGNWTSNLDVEVIRRAKGEQAAQVISDNRQRILDNNERERQAEQAEREAQAKAEQERQEREKREKLEKADRDLREGKAISGADFITLADNYGVKLPIKFIGWAREYLATIKKPFLFLGKHFNVPYQYFRGHDSKSLYDNAKKVFDAMGIVAESDGETYESYKAKHNPENASSTAPPPRPAQKTDSSQKSEPLKITKSEWDKIHKDYKGEWTRERWEWDNDFPEEFIGRKTVIEQALPDSVFERSGRKKEYGSGSVLITEGGGFEIIPDERQNANNAPASPYDNIPDELKSLKQWTVYKTYPDKDNPGKLKKVIISPIDSSFAHSDAPDMWASYEQAKAYADRHGYKGLVFALGTGITFIDIDRAVDKDSGAIVSPEARRLLELIPDSYTERSVSGTGIHILVKGSLPSDAYRRNDAKGIEMYDNRRFICVTGDTINGSREVKDYSDRIAAIAYEFAGRRPPRKEYTPVPATQSDNELIGRIEISKQGAKFEALYRGDISGYPSHSHADSAIVFTLAWWTRDPAQIDRIFRSSGLMRDKWDSIRGGTTYGGQLIDEALSTVTAREQPQRQRQAEQY